MIRTPALAVFALLLSGGSAVAQLSETLRALLIRYRCPVVDRLVQIYGNPRPTDARDRFIAVTVPNHAHGYVQCMFIESRSRIYCEASSGYYYGIGGTPVKLHLPSESVAALGRLGFSTDDSKGNFRYESALGNPPDLNVLADFILRALHDGYGARASVTLDFNAPYAGGPTTVCRPVS
jgi:hypothetical protein